MGLLDRFLNLSVESTQGLLAAAAQGLMQSGQTHTPISFGQSVGGAISGFQGGVEAARRRKQEEEQERQKLELRALQISEAQGGLQDSEAKRQTAQRVARFHEDRRNRSGQPQSPGVGMGEQPSQGMASAFPGPAGSPRLGGPDWLQSYQSTLPPDQQSAVSRLGQLPEKSDKQQSIFEERLILAKEMRAERLDAQAAEIEEHAYKHFRPKYSTTPQAMRGTDGKLRNYQVSEDGGPARDMGLGVKADLVEVGLGNRKTFVDRNEVQNNQSFAVGQSPDSVASTASAAASRAQSAQQFNASHGLSRDRLNSENQRFALGNKPMTQLQETKYRTQIAKDYTSANTMLANMDDLVKSVASVKNAPGLRDATGAMAYLPSLPNGPAAQAEVRLQNLEGKVTQLGKAAAAMGGAVGPMAVQEWKIVRDMIAAIDPKKGQGPLLEQLAIVEETAAGATGRIRDGYAKHYGADFERYPQFENLAEPKAPPPPPPPTPPMQEKPKANASNRGKTILEHESGKRFRSNGIQWIEVK